MCNNENVEWIGKLFPPTFELQLKRYTSETVTTVNAGQCELAADDEASAGTAGRNVTAAMQNVCCRVHGMEKNKTLADGMNFLLDCIY
jgi:hypothetical protein